MADIPPDMTLEMAWELYMATQKKLEEKDEELMSLWKKMEESGIESIEILKEENAKLKARVSELESARPQPAVPVTKPVVKPGAKPAPPVVKLPSSPVKQPAPSELEPPGEPLPELDALPELGVLDALPALDEPVASLPELPDIAGGLPPIDAPPKPPAAETPPKVEKPAQKPVPEKPAAVPSKQPEKPPEPQPAIKEHAAAPVQKKEPVPEAQPVQVTPQAPVPVQGPAGVRIANVFNQPVAEVAEFIENGFAVLHAFLKDNHSGEEIGMNLDLFRNRLKDIVGFSQSLFPMMTTARNLKKSKEPLPKQVVEEMDNNLFRWKAEIIGHLK